MLKTARTAVGLSLATLGVISAVGGCSSSGSTGRSGDSSSTSPPRNSPAGPAAPASIALSSPAFRAGGLIPVAYTCDASGSATSPPLTWSNLPAGTGWLALYAYDNTGSVLHWVVIDIKPSVHGVPAGSDGGGVEVTSFLPICPGTGNTHQYQFTIYAEPAGYQPPKFGASFGVDPTALAAHALATGVLDGVYTE